MKADAGSSTTFMYLLVRVHCSPQIGTKGRSSAGGMFADVAKISAQHILINSCFVPLILFNSSGLIRIQSNPRRMEAKVANGQQHGKQQQDSEDVAKLGVPQNGEGRRMSAAAVFWSAGHQVSLDSVEQPHRDVNRAAGLSQQRAVLSTHVLDVSTGRPAHGLHCKAYKWDRSHSEWTQIGETVTNAQGRVPAVHPTCPLSRGTYKLRFAVKEYFARHQLKTLFPHIDIVIDVDDPACHLHVPLQLTPYGFTVYKGC